MTRDLQRSSGLWLATPIVRDALEFAAAAHQGQTRRDGSPFLHHLVEVASLLQVAGFDETVIAAGLLHDALERTATTASALEDRFGTRVGATVAALTEDPDIASYEERKAALRASAEAAGPEAHAVFAADKAAKVRELRARWAPQGAGRRRNDARRLEHYRASFNMLRGTGSAEGLVALLELELWLAAQLEA
jgi:(p)ppGpp synthase/HD superfamily hydrolase